MTVFETARTGIKSISWTKRVVLVLAASLVISAVAALSLAPSGANDEFVDSTSVAESSNFLALAFLAFVAGALSFISPCTLPILPAYFAFTFQADRKRIATMTVAFFLGLALIFSLLGASSSVLGSLLSKNILLLTRVGGVLLIVFGIMSLFGRGFTGPTLFRTNCWRSFKNGYFIAIGIVRCHRLCGPVTARYFAGRRCVAAAQRRSELSDLAGDERGSRRQRPRPGFIGRSARCRRRRSRLYIVESGRPTGQLERMARQARAHQFLGHLVRAL